MNIYNDKMANTPTDEVIIDMSNLELSDEKSGEITIDFSAHIDQEIIDDIVDYNHQGYDSDEIAELLNKQQKRNNGYFWTSIRIDRVLFENDKFSTEKLYDALNIA